jgi:hypothetical protein
MSHSIPYFCCIIESVINRYNGLGTQIGCFGYVWQRSVPSGFWLADHAIHSLSAIMDPEVTSLECL